MYTCVYIFQKYRECTYISIKSKTDLKHPEAKIFNMSGHRFRYGSTQANSRPMDSNASDGFDIQTITTYIDHIEHKEHTRQTRIPNPVNVPCLCDICDKWFANAGDLTEHMKTHANQKYHQCGVCRKVFEVSDHLAEHMKAHSDEDSFCCGICEKWFTSAGDLAVHMTTHSNHKYHKCGICKIQIASFDNLAEHMKLHLETKSFACDICEEKFTTSESLNKHKSLPHTDISQIHSYSCYICDKWYKSTKSLNTHMKTHYPSKAIKCDICDKIFQTESDLTMHIKEHYPTYPGDVPRSDGILRQVLSNSQTTENHFVCEVCDTKFSRYETLSWHKLNHSTSYPCDICQERSIDKQSLYTHMKIHSAEQAFDSDVWDCFMPTEKTCTKNLRKDTDGGGAEIPDIF